MRGSEDAVDKGSLSLEAMCVLCARVHRGSVGVFVTDTRLSPK